MKKLTFLVGLLLLTFTIVTCNEDQFLNEVPEDFFTSENAYQQPQDFQLAVNRLYSQVRDNFYIGFNPSHGLYPWYATDMAWDAIAVTHEYNLYDKIVPEAPIVEYYWIQNYDLIKNANAIISRIDNENVQFSDESERQRLIAEARFFRALAYRYLGIMYGDVPLVLEEVKEPKRDYVRAPLEEVWTAVIADLQFAAENLPEVTSVNADGMLTKAAANHLLSEVYIITEDYNNAINAASAVIDNPNYALMRNRFGTRVDEPGDVHWDLHRLGNQNRSSGNTETIWAIQFEYQTPGGGGGNWMNAFINPFYMRLVDSDGTNLFLGFTSQNGGRTAGWASTSVYMDTLIWDRSGWEEDLRNSEFNIVRDIVSDNPESNLFGQKIIENGALDYNPNNLRRDWHEIHMKMSTPGNFPEEFVINPETGEVRGNAASLTWKDIYVYRLAETYLLRAEAHLLAGNTAAAAEDINVVRRRANAPDVSPGEVDLDYILDERARELAWEGTFRRLTLMRMNKLVERVREYNPVSASSISEHHKLFPIPQSEIERNTEAELTQNPGY